MKATLSFPSCQHCKVCDSYLILSLIPLLYLKYNRIYILLFLFHTRHTLLHIEFSVDPPHPSTHPIFCQLHPSAHYILYLLHPSTHPTFSTPLHPPLTFSACPQHLSTDIFLTHTPPFSIPNVNGAVPSPLHPSVVG